MEFLVETMVNYTSEGRGCLLKCQEVVARVTNRNGRRFLARHVNHCSSLHAIPSDVEEDRHCVSAFAGGVDVHLQVEDLAT